MKTSLYILAGLTFFRLHGQAAPLQISFDSNGLSSLKAEGKERLLPRPPTIWRHKTASGASLGMKPLSTVFDKTTRRHVTTYPWGSMTTTYQPVEDGLRLTVAVENTGTETIRELNFDLLSFSDLGANRWFSRPADGAVGPALVLGKGAEGSLAYALEGDSRGLQLNFYPNRDKAGARVNVRLTLGGERIIADNIVAERPIAPQSRVEFTALLRVGGPATPPLELARDVIEAYRKTHPMQLKWNDRRPILRLFMGGGLNAKDALVNLQAQDKITAPAPDPKLADFLQKRMLGTIQAATAINAQGVIFWDLEGDTFPHPTTYIGDPRLIRVLNPQLDQAIDQAFQTLRAAGLRVGVTLRPSHVIYHEDKQTAFHSHTIEPLEELDAKVAYAKNRWGCTVFYVDTNFFWRAYGGKPQAAQLAPELWQKLGAKYPDTLFIPEFGHPADYAFTAPYGEADMGEYSTPDIVRAIWPEAWRVLVIEDSDPNVNFDRFVSAVRGRNALMTYAFSSAALNVVASQRIVREAALLDAPVPPALEKATPAALTQALAATDPAIRFHAARLLAETPAGDAAVALLALALDVKQEWIIRRRALLALAKVPHPAAIPALLELIADGKQGLYAAATLALKGQGAAAVEPVFLRYETALLAKDANAERIQSLGTAVAAICPLEMAPRLEELSAKISEGKNAANLRRSLLGTVGQLRNPAGEALQPK